MIIPYLIKSKPGENMRLLLGEELRPHNSGFERESSNNTMTTTSIASPIVDSYVSDADDDDTEMVKLRPELPNLVWKDSEFQDQTLVALNQMRRNKHFCDVTLQIGQYDIAAHRVVLAAASPYWMELFTAEGDQPTRKEVSSDGGILYELNGGCQKDALEKLVEYSYTSKLDVTGDQVKPVYIAAVRLKMDRVASECARYMLSHLDLASCLEMRSMPLSSRKKKTAVAFSNGDEKNVDMVTNGTSNGSSGDNGGDFISEVDKFIEINFDQLRETRELRSLPRICLEILHLTKEEKEMAIARPLCELVLDWIREQWLDDETFAVEHLTKRRHLLFLANDNTLQDCQVIEQGSINDSVVIQDYKKGNQHLKPRESKKRRQFAPAVKPSKPRELLYSRHINQDDHAKLADVNDGWKIIACDKLDDQSILAIATIDRLLVTFSIMQRINRPTSPQMNLASMGSNFSSGDLSENVCRASRSPKLSRPPSIEKEMAYTSVAVMPQAKCAVGAASLNGKLVVCGGYDRGECLNTFEMYDRVTNTWVSLPPMLGKRGRFDASAVDDSRLFAVAGSNGQTEEQSVEKFDWETMKWTNVASLPIRLSNIGVCNLNGQVYCVGGTYGQSGTKYCFKFVEDEDRWQRIASMHTGRLQAAVTGFQGKIWVAGGCDAWNPLRTVEIYDPSTDTWKYGPPMSTPRRGCGLAVRKGHLIVVGGSDGTQSLCTTEIYDPVENTWRPGPTMTTCRTNVAVAVVEERLWAVGGFSGKVFLNTAEFLDAESEEWTTFIAMPTEAEETDQQSSEGDEESSVIIFSATGVNGADDKEGVESPSTHNQSQSVPETDGQSGEGTEV